MQKCEYKRFRFRLSYCMSTEISIWKPVFRVSYIFKDLIMHIGQEKSRQSSWWRSTSNPEGPTAFDDLE